MAQPAPDSEKSRLSNATGGRVRAASRRLECERRKAGGRERTCAAENSRRSMLLTLTKIVL
jgi:hypothetical protein